MKQLAFIVTLLVAGCVTTSSSSFLPIPVTAGAGPGRGRARLSGRVTGLPSVGRSSAPAEGSQWVPAVQVDLDVGIRPSRYFGTRLHGSLAPDSTAVPAGSLTIERPGSMTGHLGLGIFVRIPIDQERTGVDLTFDTSYFFAPAYLVDSRAMMHRPGLEILPMFEGGAFFSHFFDRWVRLVLGVTLRNHPSLGSAFATGVSDSFFRFGNAISILSAAAEVHVTEWLSITPVIEWPWIGLPFSYSPTLGLGIALTMPGGPGSDPWMRVAPRDPAGSLGRPF